MGFVISAVIGLVIGLLIGGFWSQKTINLIGINQPAGVSQEELLGLLKAFNKVKDERGSYYIQKWAPILRPNFERLVQIGVLTCEEDTHGWMYTISKKFTNQQ